MSVGPRHVVVMGVSGCGKTTVAERLAGVLGWPMAEGDRFHPQASIDKMSAGVPLDDEDRLPWLRTLAAWIAEQEAAGRSSVLACSALRRSYRDLLRGGAEHVAFVHLTGDRAVLEQRLSARAGHFFTARLLDSQLATLEPLGEDEDGVDVDLVLDPDAQVRVALDGLHLG